MKRVIYKDKNKRLLVQKYEKERLFYKIIINNESLPNNVRWHANFKLASLPKNSAKNRISNRCIKTGRSRSVHKFVKLSRIILRKFIIEGQVPGFHKI